MYHQAGSVRNERTVPTPTISVMRVGLSPYEFATMDAPICGPIADFEQCHTRRFPVLVERPHIHDRDQGRADQQLEGEACYQRPHVVADLVQPQLEPDRNERERNQRRPDPA